MTGHSDTRSWFIQVFIKVSNSAIKLVTVDLLHTPPLHIQYHTSSSCCHIGPAHDISEHNVSGKVTI